MPLRVGFDMDGTVADMHTALHREAVKLFGNEVLRKAAQSPTKPASDPRDDVSASEPSGDDDQPNNPAMQELHLTARQQMQLWDHVKKIENFWVSLPELEPGIISRIAKAATERRWEIIFLTTRPSTAGELVQLQSQRWLNAHGLTFPCVYVVHRSRGRIADALHLDAVVDDRPENCLDIAVESKAKVILIWHGNLSAVPPGAKRLGVRAVTTISEALSLLEQLDDTRNKPGFLRSIKRALGAGASDF